MTKSAQASSKFDDRLVKAGDAEALSAIREAGSAAESLVSAWVAAGNAGAVLEVSERGEGPVRKAARRGLNVLRSRGVAIPALHRVAVIAPANVPDVVEAWMMAPDSSGMQVFAITSRSSAGKQKVALVFLHSAQGVARVDNALLSQSQLREHFAKLLPGSGYSATKVPVEWARRRIADARAIHKGRGLPEPLGMTTAAPLIEPAPEAVPVHPFDEEGLELADEDAADLAKESGKLHNLPEFRSWLPSNQAMQELLVNVGSKLAPGETPEPGVVTEHIQAEVLAATDRFFTPEIREEILRRMKDSGLSVLAREGEQRALEIAAAIQVVAKCGLVTNPPRDVPFLRTFFDKAVALMIAQGGGRLRIPVANPGLAAAEQPTADESA